MRSAVTDLPSAPPPSPYDEVRRVIDAKEQEVTRDVSSGAFDEASGALDEHDVVARGRSLLAERRKDADEAERLKAEYAEATQRWGSAG
jgi:hypothetical protein